MATGHDFVVRMLLATAQYDRALKQSQTNTGRAASAIDKRMKRTRQGFTEVSRGVQDIASVMGAGGSFAQGLNGASNNFGELLTRIHPLAGVIAGVGLALGGPFLAKLFDMKNGLSESQMEVNGLTAALQELERQGTNMQRLSRFGFNINRINTADQARNARTDRQAERAGLNARRESLKQQLQALSKRFNIGSANAITKERGRIESRFNKKGEERFEALDDEAKRRVVDKFLEIEAKLKDVAEASRAVTVESISLAGKLRELKAAEKKAADEKSAKKKADELAKSEKKEADRLAREQQRRDRERRSKQQQADSLLARMNPLEEFQQRADKINTLFNEGFLDKSQFADAIDELGRETQDRILKGSDSPQRSKPQFASALSFGSSEGFSAIARAIRGSEANSPQKQTAKQTKQMAELQSEMNILLEQIKQNTKPNQKKPITIGS